MDRRNLHFISRAVPGLILLSWIAGPVTAQEADKGLSDFLLTQADMAGGICSLPRCGDGSLAVGLATSSSFLVHGRDHRPEKVAAARTRAQQHGLLGTRMVIETGTLGPLPYADNLVDLILLTDFSSRDAATLPRAELLRVLRPQGKAILGRSNGGERVSTARVKAWLARMGFPDVPVFENAFGVWAEITKPPLAGIDSWSHWYHNPDNNPVSSDTVIQAPYMTQWMGQPYYVAMPTITTAAGGRVFVASGHIAHHQREVPTLNLLTARNGYNGQVLWTRPLPEGYLVHRSAFVATEDLFYLMDGDAVLLLDAETGQEIGRYSVPGIKGYWNWMALQDGVLYVQAGDQAAPAKTTEVRSEGDHWSWGSLSPGYYQQPRVPWGFGRHLAAFDMEAKKTLWTHTEPQLIDARALGLGGGRLFFYAPDSRIGCLETASGRLRWKNDDPEVLAKIEQPGQQLVSTPGFRSSCSLLCTEQVLFFETQTRQNVLACSSILQSASSEDTEPCSRN